MTTIEVGRAVAADPSSVALVLAGPASRELWPRQPTRRVGVVGAQRPALTVTVDAPRRSGVEFNAGVAIRRDDVLVAEGRLSIRPTGAAGGCDVGLSLSVAEDMVLAVERDAARYLDEVAAVSRARSSAA